MTNCELYQFLTLLGLIAYCWVIDHMKRFAQQSGYAVHWQPSVDIAERKIFKIVWAHSSRLLRFETTLLFSAISIHLSQVSDHKILVAKMRLLLIVFRYSRKALCDIYVSLHNIICFFHWECTWLVLYCYNISIALLYYIVKWRFMWEIKMLILQHEFICTGSQAYL